MFLPTGRDLRCVLVYDGSGGWGSRCKPKDSYRRLLAVSRERLSDDANRVGSLSRSEKSPISEAILKLPVLSPKFGFGPTDFRVEAPPHSVHFCGSSSRRDPNGVAAMRRACHR